MILDIVIEEGIIRVDHCDHTTFPYIQSILSASHLRYHFYDSYHRLRLVCRSFKAILGDPPSQILSPSSIFPLSITIRALILDLAAWPRTDFQLLSAEALSYRRLVYLDATCGLTPSLDQPNLSDFLARVGEPFHNIQRLTLRITNHPYAPHVEKSLWARLNDAFPRLVTLVITEVHPRPGYVTLIERSEGIVTFQWLEALYLDGSIRYAKCLFPRLRQASVRSCSQSELEILTASPYLESLFIHSFYKRRIDLNSCWRLKLLGVPMALCYELISPERDHPLDHLWVFYPDQTAQYGLIKQLLERFPGISRVTIDLSSVFISEQWRTQVTQGFQSVDFASIGMNVRPRVHGDSLLVIERSPHQLST
jgi:hypothetical protein